MIELVVQNVSQSAAQCPDENQFKQWAEVVRADGEVCLRIVDEPEMSQLNQQYRGKQGPTNVLSFPLALPPGIPVNHLGDIVVCAPVVFKEARDQGKAAVAHWAHMMIHGLLHLLGHDHIEESEAQQMEQIEIESLKTLGFDNPYAAMPAGQQ
ncbi:MAG: endoribonuclease YbeY [Lysobacteraceae bacterium]|nr:MAG: endoribonuclease YbeY [Xanthomonadaceae bacterium]